MRIRNIFMICVLSLLTFVTYGQSFPIKIATVYDDQCWNVVENPQGGYFLGISQGTFDPSELMFLGYNDVVYKIENTGSITDSIVFYDSDTLYFRINRMFVKQDQLLLYSVVYAHDNLMYASGIRLTLTDFDLNIVHDTLLFKPGYYWTPIPNPVINRSGNLVIPGKPKELSSGNWYNSMDEISINGDILQETALDFNIPLGSIIELPAAGGYHILDLANIVFVDSILENAYSVFHLSPYDTLRPLIGYKAINDSLYIISGQTSEPRPPWSGVGFDLGFGIYDKNGQYSKIHQFGVLYTDEFPGPFDFISTDNIFFSVRQEYIQPNEMCIYNYKMDGTLNWNKCYGLYYNIAATAISTTSDGGCILVGKYQTENSGYNEFDLVIMKINSDGTITDINKPGEANVNVAVYPNPGESVITISSKVSGCIFSLYDNTGRMVLQKKLTTNKDMLDTTGLPAGFYTYRINSPGSLVATGKWVKL